MDNKKVIIIGGATASGKSALSLYLATRLNCEIFSADSRQLYRELQIGTAKPSLSELAMVKHHFINHISIHESYSSAQYASECRLALSQYLKHNDVAIVAGGTGFYLDMLLNGMDEIPHVPTEVVKEVENLLLKSGLVGLQSLLIRLDPECFEIIDRQNQRRLMRAISVCLASGQKYSTFTQNKKNPLPYQIYSFLLNIPRDVLYHRINLRVDHMVAEGLKEEALTFQQYRYLPSLETVGYREWYMGLDQGSSDQEVIEQIKMFTRRYAKRQLTWFSKYGVWKSIAGSDIEIQAEQVMDLCFR